MTYDAQGFLDGTASELDYETMVVAALRWLTYFGNNVHFEHSILLLCNAFFRAIKLQPKCEMTNFEKVGIFMKTFGQQFGIFLMKFHSIIPCFSI